MQIQFGKKGGIKYLGIHPELSDQQLELIRTCTDIGSDLVIEKRPNSEICYSELGYTDNAGHAGLKDLKATSRQIAQVFRNRSEIVEINEKLHILERDQSLFENQTWT
jgi:hypothetical protein